MFESLVITYGYAMILVGTFFEGETVLVIGGYLSHAGYLELPKVIVFAVVGTFASDQLFFHIGRRKGADIIAKRPQWRRKARYISRRIHRHQIIVILGFRFLYGFRTVTPLLLGASGIAPVKFLILNLAGALMWAAAVASLGYLLGRTFSLIIAETHRYELYGAAAIALAGSGIWLWHYVCRSGKKR